MAEENAAEKFEWLPDATEWTKMPADSARYNANMKAAKEGKSSAEVAAAGDTAYADAVEAMQSGKNEAANPVPDLSKKDFDAGQEVS